MKTRIGVPALLFALLVSPSIGNAFGEKEPDAKQRGAEPGASAAPKSPQYGAWGFDTAGADLKAKPGDDFFRYANGAWLDRVEIPADKAAYSLRLAMTDTTEQRLHDLIEAVAKKAEHEPTSTDGKVGAFYKSF